MSNRLIERHARLREFLKQSGVKLNGHIHDEVGLITSGLVNSLALFNLMLWIEEEIGQPVNVTRIDIRKEWNTCARIVQFIDRRTRPEP